MTDLSLITINQFGQYAPEVDTSAYTSATVSGFITTASKIATDYLGYTPLAEDIVDEMAQGIIDNTGDLVLFPNKIPVQSVSAIALVRGTVTLDLTLTAGGITKYNIDYTQRHVRYPAEEIATQSFSIYPTFYVIRGNKFYTKISYRGGWEPSALPAPIQQAVVLIVKDLLSGRYNPTGAVGLSQGAVSFTFRNDSGESLSRNMKDAYRLLGPYRQI